MPFAPRSIAAAALLSVSAGSNAAQLDFNGSLSSTTSVASIFFNLSLTIATVDLWTDSFANGSNFDPVIQLWKLSGPGTGTLLGENDDYTVAVSPSQTSLDSALSFGALTPGSYLLTIVASPNGAVSTALGDGFLAGNGAGQPLGTGPAYAAHITFLGTGVTVVPEPPVWLLMGLGAAALGWRRRAAVTA